MADKMYRCPTCKTPEEPWGHEFIAPEPGRCPRCHAEGPALLELVAVHLYAPDQSGGPVLGEYGKRYKVACKPNATNPHGVPCTGEASAVTCPNCKATSEYRTALELSRAVTGGVVLSADDGTRRPAREERAEASKAKK